MKWMAYCTVCGRFLPPAGRKKSEVLAFAQEHANDETHTAEHVVAVGLCSYLKNGFIFTALSEVRRERPIFSKEFVYVGKRKGQLSLVFEQKKPN